MQLKAGWSLRVFRTTNVLHNQSTLMPAGKSLSKQFLVSTCRQSVLKTLQQQLTSLRAELNSDVPGFDEAYDQWRAEKRATPQWLPLELAEFHSQHELTLEQSDDRKLVAVSADAGRLVHAVLAASNVVASRRGWSSRLAAPIRPASLEENVTCP